MNCKLIEESQNNQCKEYSVFYELQDGSKQNFVISKEIGKKLYESKSAMKEEIAVYSTWFKRRQYGCFLELFKRGNFALGHPVVSNFSTLAQRVSSD